MILRDKPIKSGGNKDSISGGNKGIKGQFKNPPAIRLFVKMGALREATEKQGQIFKNKVKLLARGATSGWTPKNLGSAFISYATDYLVKNTE